nr:MAG TPA: hypothetical protein [Caudoviricetes sp.]
MLKSGDKDTGAALIGCVGIFMETNKADSKTKQLNG